MKKVLPISQLKAGPIQHPVLTDAFIARVKAYKAVLGNTETTPLEQALDGFRRDQNPEAELVVWERITQTYQAFLADKPVSDLATKKEVLAVLLGASVGAGDWRHIKHLDRTIVTDLIARYRGLS